MSIEQVAQDLVVNMTDIGKIKTMVSADAMASGGVLPQAIPIMDSMQVVSGLKNAFPDWHINVEKVTVNGDKATVNVWWGGNQTGSLNLPIPGMSPVAATGKKVWVKDAYIVTVHGDKVTHFEVISPADGGIPGALMQLGVKLPPM